MSSYYENRIENFIKESDESILGLLANSNRHDLETLQRAAWNNQIEILKDELKDIDGTIHLEFVIPRMGKRADCVVISKSTVFVIEFKNGASNFDKAAIDQAHDYALDLKDFHKGSHNARLIPILVATKATHSIEKLEFRDDNVAEPILLAANNIGKFINKNSVAPGVEIIDAIAWGKSGYSPTPTIVEAARYLFRKNGVKEITRTSKDNADNLEKTSTCVNNIIEKCKLHKKKGICFITGVPGAGKTLAGLNIATQRQKSCEEDNTVFLSGNGPLVEVLTAALSNDYAEQNNTNKKDAERIVHAFIQNIHHFRDTSNETDTPPVEHVVVFDEAQRAWDMKKVARYMKEKRNKDSFKKSESQFLIEVMDRHQDWCTIICLIGGGQEINTGEAGVGEWLLAIKNYFPDWEVHTSAQILGKDYAGDNYDIKALIEGQSGTLHEELHLGTCIRSFRAGRLSDFVAALLDNKPDDARLIHTEIKDKYKIYICRNIDLAKKWVSGKSRGTRRAGLIASSGAKRLQPEGVFVECEIEPSSWFLNPKGDIRSSHQLEKAATEFDIQGLEIDWSCLCWDGDLRYSSGNWDFNEFRGSAWNQIKSPLDKKYLKNAYRVLLTRAREGMVIFIPEGCDNDPTTLKVFYEQTAEFLLSCGVTTLNANDQPNS